jgi:hypothetical protein
MRSRRLEDPPMHVPATLGANDGGGLVQQLWSDLRHLIPVMWVHDEVDQPRVVAARHLAVRNHVVVPRFPCHESGETRTPTLAQVDPQVIRKWALSIGSLHGLEKIFDVRHVVHRQSTLDVDVRHQLRLAIR